MVQESSSSLPSQASVINLWLLKHLLVYLLLLLYLPSVHLSRYGAKMHQPMSQPSFLVQNLFCEYHRRPRSCWPLSVCLTGDGGETVTLAVYQPFSLSKPSTYSQYDGTGLSLLLSLRQGRPLDVLLMDRVYAMDHHTTKQVLGCGVTACHLYGAPGT